MTIPTRLTASAACRVAGIDRDRFNEHVAAGRFNCAPATIPGRARYFTADDMIALRLFRELMEDGYDAASAGEIACEVSLAACLYREAPAISYVRLFSGSPRAIPTHEVPTPSDWHEAFIAGSDIRNSLTFNIGKIRRLLAHYIEEEKSTVGDDD